MCITNVTKILQLYEFFITKYKNIDFELVMSYNILEEFVNYIKIKEEFVMATNPMQRKARNSFLLGMLLMLIICGLIIAFLFLQLKNYQDKEKAVVKVKIAVLNEDVKAGQIITSDMLTIKQIDKTLIPENAIGDEKTLSNYSLQDKNNNPVSSRMENGQNVLYLTKNSKEYELKKDDSGSYYIENNGNKEYVQLNTVPVIAKVSLKKNAVLTRDTISSGNNTTSDDVRKQEYNVIVLPTQLETGEYVDIRLSMPNGQDYIVVSKKSVEIPTIDGVDSDSTIWLNLSEDEILSMSSAIVESARMPGSKLYATTYTEPGIQVAATPTYVVNADVLKQIADNPNVVTEAKNELASRYSNGGTSAREAINSTIQNNADKTETSLETTVQESITKTQEERKKYLDSLGSSSSSTSSSSSSSTSSTTSSTN